MTFDDFIGWCLMAVTVGTLVCAMIWVWERWFGKMRKRQP
jgi:hypothetical protein